MDEARESTSTGLQQRRRALVVAAHPDDIDVNAGGTVRRWVEAGDTLVYLIATSGDAGRCGETAWERVSETRRAEQVEAARMLGVNDVRFLDGHRDGEVRPTLELVRQIVRVIRQVRPHVVMTLSPERRWDRPSQWHPDHLAVGEATVRAVYPAAGNPYAFPELLRDEGLPGWGIDELWMQDPPNPNHAEIVTAVAEVKRAAVLAHASQFPQGEETDREFKRRMLDDARSFGLPEGTLAELFRRVRLSSRTA